MRRRLPLLVLLVSLPACSAVTAPPSLTAAERARLAAARLELTLGVGQHRASWPREDLVPALAQRRLFLRVDRLEALVEPPDLVPTVQAFGNPDHPLPVVTCPTLGTLPTVAQWHAGARVTLAPPAARP